MLNRAILTGRLTKDPEVQYTQQGTPVLPFTLAVSRQFRNKDGDREADFVQCVIWRKGAENLAKFTHKGSLIGIDGRIQTRNYENDEGQRIYVTEINVDHFALLDPKKSNQKSDSSNENTPLPPEPPANNSQPVENHNSALPFNTGQQGQHSEPVVDENDLPF